MIAFAFHPSGNVVYAGIRGIHYAVQGYETRKGGVAISYDGGISWSIARQEYQWMIWDLMVPEREPALIFAAVHSGSNSTSEGLWVGSAFGNSWRNLIPGRSFDQLRSSDPDSKLLYAGANDSIYKIQIDTLQWEKLSPAWPTNSDIRDFAIQPGHPQFLCVALYPSTVTCGSANGGDWKDTQFPGSTFGQMVFHPRETNKIYALDELGVLWEKTF